jgi:hypothetical protein
MVYEIFSVDFNVCVKIGNRPTSRWRKLCDSARALAMYTRVLFSSIQAPNEGLEPFPLLPRKLQPQACGGSNLRVA